jgi:hypothetical protein
MCILLEKVSICWFIFASIKQIDLLLRKVCLGKGISIDEAGILEC